ncbi:Uncharacterised protein [uncultured archaeon]|nr:Uncharacterised protein [uncultured archaeon]
MSILDISEVTRRNIIDSLLLKKYLFHGRLDLISFLKRIWNLSTMPSTDIRFKNAEGDIWQHVINNPDYDYDYLLYKYFNLLNCDDDTFLKFIETCLHPVVLSDEKQVFETLSEFNKFLMPDGYRLEVDSQISGRPVYKAIKFKSIEGFISTSIDVKKVKKVMTFSPSVFNDPEKPIDPNLVSVMMPFKMEYDKVLETIRAACHNVGMTCKRVDDIWNNSTIVQDIFELICCSSIVIVDFSGKNPNVFYETGIAHTLGKNVIPITQNIEDIPFDLRHHRFLQYLNNNEGLLELKKGIEIKLKALAQESKTQ